MVATDLRVHSLAVRVAFRVHARALCQRTHRAPSKTIRLPAHPRALAPPWPLIVIHLYAASVSSRSHFPSTPTCLATQSGNDSSFGPRSSSLILGRGVKPRRASESLLNSMSECEQSSFDAPLSRIGGFCPALLACLPTTFVRRLRRRLPVSIARPACCTNSRFRRRLLSPFAVTCYGKDVHGVGRVPVGRGEDRVLVPFICFFKAHAQHFSLGKARPGEVMRPRKNKRTSIILLFRFCWPVQRAFRVERDCAPWR